MKTKSKILGEIVKKLLCVVLLVGIALFSIFVVSKKATDPKSYSATIASIDEKKATVTTITASAAAASTALALIPGEATTPIANQILEISSYLLIVVCALVLEKSLLTVMGYISFTIIVPLVCGLAAAYILAKKEVLKQLAWKFAILAIMFATIIPFSVKVSDMMCEVNKTKIEQVTIEAEETVEEDEEEKSWLQGMLDKAKKSATKAVEKGKRILNNFIDVIAMFIIAYCAMPILVVLLMMWVVKILFNIPVPNVEKLISTIKRIKEEEIDDLIEE